MRPYQWKVNRGDWNIVAKKGNKTKEDKNGFFETSWTVKIKSGPCQNKYDIELYICTQYDNPLRLIDSINEFKSNFLSFSTSSIIESYKG